MDKKIFSFLYFKNVAHFIACIPKPFIVIAKYKSLS